MDLNSLAPLMVKHGAVISVSASDKMKENAEEKM